VHSPEFSYDREPAKQKPSLQKHGIPVHASVDNDVSAGIVLVTEYWPAMYLIDKKGIIRYV